MDIPMTRDEAITLDQNELWRKLVKEIDKMIYMESERLLHCDVDECVKLQERVKALRFATRLPMLVAEREEEDEPAIIKV